MTTGPDSTPKSAGRVPNDALTAAREMSEWVGQLTIEGMMHPPADSPAGQDRSAVAGDEIRLDRLTRGLGVAGMRFHSGRSCLDALVVCQTIGDPVTATHSLARVVFETSAWARWLCRLDIGVEERISRMAADELYGMIETRKMMKELDVPVTYDAELRDLLATAGITPADRPHSTTVVGQVLGEEIEQQTRMLYRLLCAHPHGSSHVWLSSTPSFGEGIKPFKHACMVFLWAFWYYTQYIGWEPLPKWAEWAEAAKPCFILDQQGDGT